MGKWRPGLRVHDGSRPPLPVLPRYPAMRGFTALHDATLSLGFRHAAELLTEAPAGPDRGAAFRAALPGFAAREGFRILDGLWLPGRGNLWRRVDAAHVRLCRDRWRSARDDSRATVAAALLDTLETVQRDDPMGLRQVVLWQLACLLRDGRLGPTKKAATALGVHADEAGVLAAAVAAGFPGPGPARRAAEAFGEIRHADRPREALRIAADLEPGNDPRLLAVLAELRSRAAAADRLIAEVRRPETGGDRRACAAAWLGAVRLVPDDQDAWAGLLRASAALADAPPAPAESAVSATYEEHTVRLAWRPPRIAASLVGYRVLRFPEGMPEQAAVLAEQPATAPAARSGRSGVPGARDDDPPLGVPVRYAVVPLLGDRIAGVPRVTASFTAAPVVTRLRAEPVPDGVRLRWRAHPAAAEVRAVRRVPGGAPVPVPCDRTGLVDRPLPPGGYDYDVACGYRGPGGVLTWSRGRRVTATAERWPAPVKELTVHRPGAGGAVTVSWSEPDRGDGRLVRWSAPLVPPGQDVSARLRQPLTDAATRSGGPLRTVPGPGEAVTVTAVSVLGDRAVAGPSVVIENPAPVRGLAVRRLTADRAELRFRWPDQAVLVRVEWERDGRREQRHLPRSRYLAEGRAEIPVDARGCPVTVTALPRPDALVLAPAEPGRAAVPAAPAPSARPTRRTAAGGPAAPPRGPAGHRPGYGSPGSGPYAAAHGPGAYRSEPAGTAHPVARWWGRWWRAMRP